MLSGLQRDDLRIQRKKYVAGRPSQARTLLHSDEFKLRLTKPPPESLEHSPLALCGSAIRGCPRRGTVGKQTSPGMPLSSAASESPAPSTASSRSARLQTGMCGEQLARMSHRVSSSHPEIVARLQEDPTAFHKKHAPDDTAHVQAFLENMAEARFHLHERRIDVPTHLRVGHYDKPSSIKPGSPRSRSGSRQSFSDVLSSVSHSRQSTPRYVPSLPFSPEQLEKVRSILLASSPRTSLDGFGSSRSRSSTSLSGFAMARHVLHSSSPVASEPSPRIPAELRIASSASAAAIMGSHPQRSHSMGSSSSGSANSQVVRRRARGRPDSASSKYQSGSALSDESFDASLVVDDTPWVAQRAVPEGSLTARPALVDTGKGDLSSFRYVTSVFGRSKALPSGLNEGSSRKLPSAAAEEPLAPSAVTDRRVGGHSPSGRSSKAPAGRPFRRQKVLDPFAVGSAALSEALDDFEDRLFSKDRP